MKEFFHHLFVPRASNNHRSRVLHHDSLLIFVAILLFCLSLFTFLQNAHAQVFGVSTTMTATELLSLTNYEREKKQLAPLTLNQQLAEAADLKAHDMFAKDYWSHNAPDGTTPWYFIQQSGYNYLYAGENLARGFTTSEETVSAWMASPSHRENILSPNYTEVGFSIATGKLTGIDTVLVVEMFGNPDTGELAGGIVIPTIQPVQGQTTESALATKPLIDSSNATTLIVFGVLIFFIMVLLIDLIIVKRKQVVRVVSHNVDHILFLVMISFAAIILLRGGVL